MKKNANKIKISERLFQLYVARVAAVDLIHTARIDKRKMFVDAFEEAIVAHSVFEDYTKMENE